MTVAWEQGTLEEKLVQIGLGNLVLTLYQLLKLLTEGLVEFFPVVEFSQFLTEEILLINRSTNRLISQIPGSLSRAIVS